MAAFSPGVYQAAFFARLYVDWGKIHDRLKESIMNKRYRGAIFIAIFLALLSLCGLQARGQDYFALSHEAYDKNDLQKALEYISNALQINGRDPRVLSWAGELCDQAGYYEDGLRFGKEAVALQPDWPFHYLVVARNAQDIGDFVTAQKYFKLFIEHPSKAADEHWRSLVGLELGRIASHTYQIGVTVKLPDALPEDRTFPILLPLDDKRQKLVSYTLPPGVTEVRKEVVDGNTFLYVKAAQPFEVSTTVTTFPVAVKPPRDDRIPVVPSGMEEYLADSAQIHPNGPFAQQALEAIGRSASLRRQLANIVAWVARQLHFPSGPLKPMGDSERTLQTHTGVCVDYSQVVIALCRASGIPAREAGGKLVEDLHSPNNLADLHSWVEAWVGGEWVPIEPQKGKVWGLFNSQHIQNLKLSKAARPLVAYSGLTPAAEVSPAADKKQ